MSSQPPSPAAAPGSSQQQSENIGRTSSSPQSRADSAAPTDEPADKVDPDSSFQSNTSERHPKGKRKRTAAKDKAILEAAYSANPKPDKAARLNIVKRVSLNEKEVQIWFQNRRQNDRRKSRPLSPQEIAALQYGSMQVLPPDGAAPPYKTAAAPPSSTVPQSSAPEAPQRAHASPPSTNRPTVSDNDAVEPAGANDERRESLASVGIPVGPSSQPVEFTAGQPHQLYRSNSLGYFANRLHAGNDFQSSRRSPDSYRHEFMPAPRPPSAAPGSVLPPPQSSKFRLSMSVEGKAELVSQPSPPRLSPSALSDSSVPLDRPHFHRSHSAAGSITLPPISTLTASLEADGPPSTHTHILQQPQPRLPPRLYRSRSRDVHLWELACEANSGEHRDELTAYAERESSGSAIAAISLLRTLSSSSHVSPISHNGSVMQSNHSKRNARPSAQHNQHRDAKKPKLSRTASSVARLQTNFVNTTNDKPPMRRDIVDVDSDEPKRVKMSMLLSPSGNDSDKENWSPGDNGHHMFRAPQRGPAGRRPLPSAPLSKMLPSVAPQRSHRRVLEDGTNRFMLGRASTAPSSRRKKGESPIDIFEDGGDDADASDNEDLRRPARGGVTDDEVERFMRGEVSPSKKGAASAIAGLLALSQGNWR